MNNTETLESTALQLKALLKALSAVDRDNTAALLEMPVALETAAQLADTLYCDIVSMNAGRD